MIIIETCPICGEDLFNYMIYTNPPVRKKECMACGWSWTGKQEEVVRVPFDGNMHPTKNFDNQPCINCPSNPKNGGSGICHCTLGQMNIVY